MTIKRTTSGWAVKLTDAAEVALMGTKWIPLPLTARCTESDAIRFAASLPAYAGQTVTVEGR